MGVDTLTSSYNADTLLLVTFNPNTFNHIIFNVYKDEDLEIYKKNI